MNADVQAGVLAVKIAAKVREIEDAPQEARGQLQEELREMRQGFQRMVQADSGARESAEKSGEHLNGSLYGIDFEPEGEPGFFLLSTLIPATARAFHPCPVTVTLLTAPHEAKSEDSA